MNKIENGLASLFSNNHRYIKMDGSGFHSGKLKSIFEKAYFNAGAFATAALFGLDMLAQNTYSSIDSQTLYNAMVNTSVVTLASATTAIRGFYKEKNIKTKINEGKELSTFLRLYNKAIDTSGRSLNRVNLSETEIEGLETVSKIILAAPIIQIPVYYFLLSGIYGMNGFIVHSAMILGTTMASHNRMSKIIKGHTGQDNGYVICGEPPQTPKAKEKALGGVRAPAI